MIDLVAITDGLAAALVPSELTIYPRPPGDWVKDCIIVAPASPLIEYDRTFGAKGIAAINLELSVRLSLSAGVDNAYERMYRLIGCSNDGTSIFDLLRDDPTLAGAVSDAYAGQVSAPVFDGEELVATFGVTVHERKG